MTQAYELFGLLCLLCWLFACVLGQFASPSNARNLGLLAALIYLVALRSTDFVAFPMASLAPFGALFPALLLRNLWRWSGCKVNDFSTLEVLVFFTGYTWFILASAGRFDVDPYAPGYVALWGSLIALALLSYFLITRRYFLAGAALIGQIAWAFDIGSTNIFDHLGHGLLMPILFVMLIRRVLNFFPRFR